MYRQPFFRLTLPSRRPLSARGFLPALLPFAARTRTIASSSRRLSQAQPSPHTQFYTTFGRATLKVLTMAFLTYQIVYWAWIKLEHEEERHSKNAVVRALEAEVRTAKEKRLLDEEK